MAKKINFTLYIPEQLNKDINTYCTAKNIDSKNEFIRAAITHYLNKDYEEHSLILSSFERLEKEVSNLKYSNEILFGYIHRMHQNLIAYLPELEGEIADKANISAVNRINYFMKYFSENIKKDPSMFQNILHRFVTGEL